MGLAIVLLDALGLAAGGAWLFRRRGRGPTLGGDLLDGAALGIALTVLAGLLAFLVAPGGLFALLRLECHVLFCVLAPLLMARGLWWSVARRRRVLGASFLALGLALDGVYVHARHVEPFALEENVHVLRPERLRGLEGRLRVVVVADFQAERIGGYETDVLRRVEALRPDLLLFAGDYVQVPRVRYAAVAAAFLERIRAMRHRPRLGAFAVVGDTDPETDLFDGTFVRMLQGEAVPLAGVPVQVLGLRYEATLAPMDEEAWRAVEAFDGLTLVLGHRPDFLLDVVAGRGRAPIVGVAGHTHGGQVVLPGWGPPLTLTALPRRYASGVHPVGASWVCVSRGIGMERAAAPRIRFLCPPELLVLDLEAPRTTAPQW